MAYLARLRDRFYGQEFSREEEQVEVRPSFRLGSGRARGKEQIRYTNPRLIAPYSLSSEVCVRESYLFLRSTRAECEIGREGDLFKIFWGRLEDSLTKHVQLYQQSSPLPVLFIECIICKSLEQSYLSCSLQTLFMLL